ncbi:hypothetical protein H8E88_34690 [candidate division KSB1 bacterium]|nr:hypothetical protein [candidate division KSB1 bacterium]
MKKANTEISNKRVFQITDLLLSATSNYEIVQFCSKEWKVSERQIYNYIAIARKQIKKTYQREFKENLSWHMIVRKKLVKQLLKKNNEKDAAIILRDMADLQGYYKLRHEHTGGDGEPIKFIDVTDGKE